MRTYLVQIGSTVGMYTVPTGPVRKAFKVHAVTNDSILTPHRWERHTFATLLREWRASPRFKITRLV